MSIEEGGRYCARAEVGGEIESDSVTEDECDEDPPAELVDRAPEDEDVDGAAESFEALWVWLYCFSSLRMRRARLGRGVMRCKRSARPRRKLGWVQPE